MKNQNIPEADVDSAAVFGLTYSQLRQDLLTFGQPGFFNAANLPAGNAINGVSNPQRVSAFLHELGHAMGRVPE